MLGELGIGQYLLGKFETILVLLLLVAFLKLSGGKIKCHSFGSLLKT